MRRPLAGGGIILTGRCVSSVFLPRPLTSGATQRGCWAEVAPAMTFCNSPGSDDRLSAACSSASPLAPSEAAAAPPTAPPPRVSRRGVPGSGSRLRPLRRRLRRAARVPARPVARLREPRPGGGARHAAGEVHAWPRPRSLLHRRTPKRAQERAGTVAPLRMRLGPASCPLYDLARHPGPPTC